MSNRLAQEPSLYLQQHAENPVRWYPWGQEALDTARELDKPLLVSIGYSACHWCHVMAHESFEDAYIAGLMNEHFVCVKIDREERPELDRFYMEAVQMLHGHGGWPLNVFCLPDGRPFAGGTYFPPDDARQGIIPWPQLLLRVADAWQRKREDLVSNAEAILGNLQHAQKQLAGEARAGAGSYAPSQLLDAARTLIGEADREHGGFGGAPKFPGAMTFQFLLTLRGSARAEADAQLATGIDSVLEEGLEAMARGGLYDPIGGGFYRYCVDREWTIPHFEKMLYDNALLVSLYARASTRYRKPLYRAVVEETLGWLQRELQLESGLFAAALDADAGGEEGSFYVWTPEQIVDVLGREAGAAFALAYGITVDGNFEHGTSNPTFRSGDFEERQQFAPARAKLFEKRSLRTAPARDPKVILSWNALAVQAFAEAGWLLGEPAWLRQALALAEGLWEHLHRGEGRLHAVLYGTEPRGNASLDDQACFAQAALALAGCADAVEAGAGARWLGRAKTLAEAAETHFADAEAPGYFMTSDDHDATVPHRGKEFFDNATPCGNSTLVHVASQLAVLDPEGPWQQRLARLRSAQEPLLARAPQAVPHALSAYAAEAIGLAVIRVNGPRDLEPLRCALTARPWRAQWVLHSDAAEQPEGYQLCVGTQCQAPTLDPEALAAML